MITLILYNYKILSIILFKVLFLFSAQYENKSSTLNRDNNISNSIRGKIEISIHSNEIKMGQSVLVEAKFTPPSGREIDEYILLPFLDRKRWGSHEFPDSFGLAKFFIPLPNIGYADIEVIAVERTSSGWRGLDDIALLRTGARMPYSDIISNKANVKVIWRDFHDRKPNKSVFAMQWEPWFIPGWPWNRAPAVPLFGFYDCTNQNVLRQQILWMIDMGINSIVVDWSNHIWGAEHWTDRGEGADQIIHVTQIFLEVLADMRDEGLPVPLVSLMPGLSNGPPGTMKALNEQLEWIYQDYIRNPRFRDLWQIWDGKPLVIILDTGIMGTREGRTESAFRVPFFKQTLTWNGATEASLDKMRQEQPLIDDSRFTVRWMSSQNQLTRHHEFGYWSWMDGSLKPITTYRDGKAEAITVCTALFPELGWLSEGAYGRRNGWTYLKSMQEAEKTKPAFIMLHQYNEYTGQSDGQGYGKNKEIYVDVYSVDLSDEIEPVSLTAPGYRGDNGGWGFFYQNLTKALTLIYNKVVLNATLLAVSSPRQAENELVFEWTTFGEKPKSFNLYIDDKLIKRKLTSETYRIKKEKLRKGKHIIKIQANGVSTPFELSKNKMDEILSAPIPVVVEEEFTIK